MPLQVLSEVLGLPAAVARAAKPMWLFASTQNWCGVTALLVYRSTWLRDGDELYASVAALIERAGSTEEIYRGTVEDDGMVHGHGEWIVYLLHPTDVPVRPTDPRAVEAIRLAEEWGEPLHPMLVTSELASRLEQSGARPV